MANVLALVKDDRVRRQIELYLTELEVADLRFATFKSQAEFQELYFRDLSSSSEEAAATVAELTDGAEMKMFSEVNLMVLALDAIDDKIGPWIDKLRANLRKYKRFPASGQLRLVLLKYEEDGISKLDLLHPFLDDLIYLPLDRLVFLQKMQIFLALPKRVSPTYLFNQEVNQKIEISKIAKLDRLSDVALAIRNPVPLRKGLPGHFYMTFPGEKARLEINAKVLRSEPHPEYPGQYLVYFNYFGLTKPSLSHIRRQLSKSPTYKSLLFDDRSRFRFDPHDMFMADSSRHVFNTIVIDSDDMAGAQLAQTVTKEMDRVSVVSESSYSLFLHRYLSMGGSVDREISPPKATEAADFYRHPISLTISALDLKLMTVDPGPSDSSTFLGHPASAIFASPDKWLSLIQEKESRLLMEESVQIVSRGRTVEKLLSMQDASNQRCAVLFKIHKGATEGTVTIELGPASLSDIVAKAQRETVTRELEVIIVDTNYVPDDPTSWIEGLRARAQQVGLIKESQQLKFWLVSETEQLNVNYLNSPDLLGLLIKPVDQRQLLFSLSEHLPNPHTKYQFDNLGWTSPAMPVHVSKNVDLEALSEFGATLRSRQKLAPGSMLYLRKSIFENAPNACLAARVYACDEHPKEKGFYQVFTTYFGINDQFLKFARTWIRENYAHQKGQGG